MPTDQPEPASPGSDPVPQPQPQPQPQTQPSAPPPATARVATGRGYRTPRYSVFVGTGVVVGLLVGVGLALYGGGDTVTSAAGVLGYFAAFGVLVGGLVGGTLGVVVESLVNRGTRSRRR